MASAVQAVRPMTVQVKLGAKAVAQLQESLAEMGEERGVKVEPAAALQYLLNDLGTMRNVLDEAAAAWSPIPEIRKAWKEQAPKLTKRAFRDPDAWPAGASAEVVGHYQRGLIEALAGVQAHGYAKGDGEPLLRCSSCGVHYRPRSLDRRWWACPTGCNDNQTNRRKARAFRKAWSWEAAEARVVERAELRKLLDEEERRRRWLNSVASTVAGETEGNPDQWGVRPGPARLAELAAHVRVLAGLKWRPDTPLQGDGCRPWFHYPEVCSKCGASWDPWDDEPRAREQLRKASAWWLCPAACNEVVADAVFALARTDAERVFLSAIEPPETES
jgi:hypothetical protein